VLDALYDARDTIRLISCRQEGGAANMAEAYGKLTGKPGICFVTRGPGATNASIGVHTAFQDSTPMILFVGQAAQGHLDREAFQEVDFRAMFTPLAKWAAEIRDADRIPEYVARAFHVATSGRPGPVVLSLPEDVLSGECNTPATRRYQKSEPAPRARPSSARMRMLMRAENPLLVLGGPGWNADAIADIRKFAEALDLPVCTSFRAKDRFDNTHPNYCGDLGIGADPKLVKRIEGQRSAARGRRAPRRDDDGRLHAPQAACREADAHPCASKTRTNWTASIRPISRSCPALRLSRALRRTDSRRARRLARIPPRCAQRLRSVCEAGCLSRRRQSVRHLRVAQRQAAGECDHRQRRRQLCGLAASLLSLPRLPTLLGPTSGAMGYGVPAAIAAKLFIPTASSSPAPATAAS
jgi:acetolactate synthase-1/2/3 large subunit